MKKILLITSDFFPNTGGVARYLDSFVRFFSPHVTVFSPTTHALLYRFFWPRWLKSVWLLLRHATEYDSVFVSQLLPFGTVAFLAKFLTKKPYVISVHGLDVRLSKRSRWKRLLTHLVMQKATCVVVNSAALEKEVRELFGVQKIVVVYPGVRSGFGLFTHQKSPKPDLTPMRLLTVSRLVKRKGHERVLRALAKLKKMHPEMAIQYDIIGDGTERKRLEQLTRDLGLSFCVTFHGQTSDEQLNFLYTNADLFVMPVVDDSIDKEGFGLVFIEAAAFGVPSISTRMSGVDEAIVDGQTGWLIADGDVEALEDRIVWAITNRDALQQIGAVAQKRAIKEFDEKVQWRKLEVRL